MAEMEFTRFDRVRRWEEIAVALLKKYIDRYYKHRKQEWEADHLEYHELREDDPNFVQEYRLLIDAVSGRNQVTSLEALKEQINRRRSGKTGRSAICRPLVRQPSVPTAAASQKSQLIEVSPVSLNDGERDFVLDLRTFHDE